MLQTPYFATDLQPSNTKHARATTKMAMIKLSQSFVAALVIEATAMQLKSWHILGGQLFHDWCLVIATGEA
jgi:hypothetical protein